jgi:hypothetical protein
MKIEKTLKDILSNGFDEKDSLIKQDKLNKFVENLDKLDPKVNQKKGFSLPLIDTIGRNLTDTVFYSFKNY